MATWAIGAGSFLCYAMGLAGYLSFRDSVDGDILLNFSGVVASVFKLAVVVHLVLYIPSEVGSRRNCVKLLLRLLRMLRLPRPFSAGNRPGSMRVLFCLWCP